MGSPSYNHTGKVDLFYTFKVEAPKGINFITCMFRNSSGTFSAKMSLKIGAFLNTNPFDDSK